MLLILETVFEFSKNTRKATLVVFDNELSKKYILIGYAATDIVITNGTLNYQLNYTPLL